MANKAIIDFIFNSAKALKEIETFKDKLDKSLQAVSNTNYGQLIFRTDGAIGKIRDFRNKAVSSLDAIINSRAAKVLSGLTVAGLLASLKGSYDEIVKIGNITEKWNLKPQAVSEFANVFAQFGGSSEQALDAIDKVQNAIKELRINASGPLMELSSVMRISLRKSNGEIKNAIEVIEGLRNTFKGLNQSAKQATLDKLGITSPAMIQLLKATDKEFQEVKQHAREYGLVNERSVQSAINFQKAVGGLRQSISAFQYALYDLATPAINAFSNGLKAIANSSQTTKKVIMGLVLAIGLILPIAVALKTLIVTFAGIAQGAVFAYRAIMLFGSVGKLVITALISNVGSLGTAFTGLLSILKAVSLFFVTNPIGAALAVIAGLAALVILNWEKVKDWFNGFLTFMSNFWQDIKDNATKAVRAVVDKIKDLLSRIPLIGKYISDELKNSESDINMRVNKEFYPQTIMPDSGQGFEFVRKGSEDDFVDYRREPKESREYGDIGYHVPEDIEYPDIKLQPTIRVDAPDYPETMVPSSTVINNSTKNNTLNRNESNSNVSNNSRVTNNYNVTFNGVNNPEEFQQKMFSLVQQGAGGVR